ncbi:MAG TPA: hypothetical protein VLT36_15405, partial [Candidatus Dormibacteraeota bacterium]|nr:hypothetical protein [Candidatus Dormibacteraeota bacterium]
MKRVRNENSNVRLYYIFTKYGAASLLTLLSGPTALRNGFALFPYKLCLGRRLKIRLSHNLRFPA